MTARRNACHNRAPFRHTAWVQDGWVDGSIGGQAVHVARMVEIPFRMTRECVYGNDSSEDARRGRLGVFDSGCEGCTWRKEIA